jgi:hypothetical protein
MVCKAIKTKQDLKSITDMDKCCNGKYAESNEQMKTFAALKPNDKRAQKFNENPNYLAGLMGIKKDFTINKISVNSEGLILELFFMIYFFCKCKK